MSETKLQEKLSNNLNENIWQQTFEQTATNEAFLENINKFDLTANEETTETFGDQWLKIIKGVFLYLPGVALLFPCTLFLINMFFTGHGNLFNVIFAMPWMLLCSFMVMFGIGDVKNPKHLALPISIAAFSLFVFLISSLFGSDASWGFLANYSVYLFPIAFIIPVIVKELLDE